MTHSAVTALIARSNRLGADPKNTNYAGGNTSAKGSDTDPATGEPIDLMWVKGSGGDLGTLTEQGLAVLRLDRMRALVDVYPGPDREDEMVGLFDYTLHGRGGAAPSIDTAMHGLVDADHVDHLHPDSGIAIATAADGEALTKQIFGDRVVWIPWRRPGFQLGLDIADVQKRNPQAIGTHPRRPRHHRVGKHLRGSRSELAGDHRHRGAVYRSQRPSPAVRSTDRRLPTPRTGRATRQGRRARTVPARPRLHRQRSGRALHRHRRGPRVPRRDRASAARRTGHQLPRSLPAHQGQANGARPARRRGRRGVEDPPRRAACAVPRGLPRPTTNGTRPRGRPRCAARIRPSC